MAKTGQVPEDLSDNDRKVVEAAVAGTIAEFGRPTPEQLADPAFAAAMPVVGAATIRSLCLGEWDEVPVHAKGVRLQGARIVEELDFACTTLKVPLALLCCRIDCLMTLQDATSETLDFSGSCLSGGIQGSHLRVKRYLRLHEICVAAVGEFQLVRAVIGDELALDGASLKNPSGRALDATNISVAGPVLLRSGFAAEGEVRLLRASIGALEMDGASLKNPNGWALNADGVKVEGPVCLRRGFTAEGEIRLFRASIGALEMDGASLKNPNGRALDATHLNVAGPVLLGSGFAAEGEVRLYAAYINGNLSFVSSSISNPGRVALRLYRANIRDTLFLIKVEISGTIILLHCQAGQLGDDTDSWPSAEDGGIYLDGFTYGAFSGPAPSTAKKRLEWLAEQPKGRDFRPQPYEQLIRVLRSTGHEHDARKVAIAKQVARRRHGGFGFPRWLGSWFLFLTVGYGYRPWLGMLWLAGLIAFGTWTFTEAQRQGVMSPTVPPIYLQNPPPRVPWPPPEYPAFVPFVYSLNLAIPVIDLRQASYWIPTPRGGLCDEPHLLRLNREWWFLIYMWVHIGLGWIFTTVTVVALTGLIKKD